MNSPGQNVVKILLGVTIVLTFFITEMYKNMKNVKRETNENVERACTGDERRTVMSTSL